MSETESPLIGMMTMPSSSVQRHGQIVACDTLDLWNITKLGDGTDDLGAGTMTDLHYTHGVRRWLQLMVAQSRYPPAGRWLQGFQRLLSVRGRIMLPLPLLNVTTAGNHAQFSWANGVDGRTRTQV